MPRLLGFDEQFLRMWRFYFTSCEAVFLERRVSGVQLVLARSEWRGDLHLRERRPQASSGAQPAAVA